MLNFKSMSKRIFLLFYLLCGYFGSYAQINLVPNGDFEEVKICQSGQPNYISKYWFAPEDHVIALDDPCLYGSYWASLNNNFGIDGSKAGFMETYGFFTQLVNVPHNRLYLATQLTSKLVKDETYYFEMSFRTLDTTTNNRVSTDFTDGQAIAFTNKFPIYDHSQPNSPISLTPVLSHGLVNDFKWHKLKGCFVANGGEQFLLIGNFKANAETMRAPTGLKSTAPYASSNLAVDNVILTPIAFPIRDTVACKNETIIFNVQNRFIDSIQYLWHDNTTTPQYQSQKTERVSVRIIYPVKNCVSVSEANVQIIEPNYRSPIKDTAICQNGKVTFSAGTGLLGETIAWKSGSKERQIDVTTEGVYAADIKNRCGSWTDTFRLRVQHCGFDVFVPTAFSPNGDGVNDVFKPFFNTDFIKIESYDLRLFNRWGSLVFASQNLTDAWDGTYRGTVCETGVYIWTISARVQLNGRTETKQLSGDVTIMR